MSQGPYRALGKLMKSIVYIEWERCLGSMEGSTHLNRAAGSAKKRMERLLARGVSWESIKVTITEDYSGPHPSALVVVCWPESEDEC